MRRALVCSLAMAEIGGISFTENKTRLRAAHGFPKAHSCHRFCPKELGGCADAGFDCCRAVVAPPSLDPHRATGPPLGSACCRPANHPAPWTGTYLGRSGASCVAPLARLGTSPLRASLVRRNRSR